MNKCVCDKCGHDFAVNLVNYEKIRRGDIIVQYFSCPECLARYHVCTTDSVMRRLIRKRLEIQAEIAGGRVKPMSARKAHRLQNKLNKVIAQQDKLFPELKKCGEKILKESEKIKLLGHTKNTEKKE